MTLKHIGSAFDFDAAVWEKASRRVRFQRWLSRIRAFPRNLYYWIAHRTWDRYDIVRIPTLSCGYHDKDFILLHACFAVLTRFVDRELNGFDALNKSIQAREKELFTPGIETDEPWLIYDLSAKEVIRDLYLYWTKERPALLKQKDNDDLELYDKDNEMLIKLISIREQLWT